MCWGICDGCYRMLLIAMLCTHTHKSAIFETNLHGAVSEAHIMTNCNVVTKLWLRIFEMNLHICNVMIVHELCVHDVIHVRILVR